MKIVVAMKSIPDLQQVRIRDRKPLLDDVPFGFSAIDKSALEAAVQIKEKQDAQVIVMCAGSPELEDQVKEALAAGADEACLVVHEGALDSNQSARLLAAALQQMEGVDLILFGEGSGDNYSSQVGSRVAQILNLPQAGYVNQLELAGGAVRATRILEDGEELIELALPVVITVNADICEPRIPSVTQILKAGKKPRNVLESGQLGCEIPAPAIATVSNLAPEVQRQKIAVKSAAELLQVLGSQGFLGRE